MSTLQPALFDNSAQELVTNGTFDTDTSGWTASGASLSSVNGRLRVTKSGASAAFAYQAIPTEVGKRYHAFSQIVVGTSSSGMVLIGTSVGGSQYATSSGDRSFTATGTTAYISCFNNGSRGTYIDFDNISLRVDPFFPATVNLGNPPALEPSLVTNSQTFYTPAVSGSIRPPLLTNSQSFHAPIVAGTQALTASLLTNSQSFYTFTIAGAGTLRPSLFDTGQGFLAPTVAPGAVTLSPTLFTNTQTFFAGEIPPWRTLLPSLFSNTDAIYLPGVWGRTVSANPSWSEADEEGSDWTPVTPTDASWSTGGSSSSNWTPVIPTDGSWA